MLYPHTHGRDERHVSALLSSALIGLTCASSTLPARAQAIDCNAEFYPGQVLVQFQVGTVAAAQDAAHEAAGALGVLKEFDGMPGLQVVAVEVRRELEAIAIYENDASVEYAEPDYLFRFDAVPDDPMFTALWGLRNEGQTQDNGATGTGGADVRAAPAWDIWQGDENFRIAVIDSGVDVYHEDLWQNIWVNPAECPGGFGTCVANGLDEDNNRYVDDFYGYDFGDDDNDPSETYYHGTHVAGTIAARGNNGIGVAGINWRAKIVVLKHSLDELGCGRASSVVEAVRYCINNDIKISNNSWGGDQYCRALFYAIRDARDSGHIFVASAGNNRRDTDASPFYPAGYSLCNIIAVAATDWNDNLVDFPLWGSNYGATTVDLGAPGVNVLSTWPVPSYDDPSTPEHDPTSYRFNAGTSMAAPHVTGVVARMSQPLARHVLPGGTNPQAISRCNRAWRVNGPRRSRLFGGLP